MQNWKVALISGSAGLGTALLLKRRWTAAIIVGSVGLATVASEYPERFGEIRRRLPDYIERSNHFLDVASRVGERLAQAVENRSRAWYESLLSS